MKVEDVIKRHTKVKMIGSPGFPLPLGEYVEYSSEKTEDLEALKSLGINVSGSGGHNTVWVESGFRTSSFEIGFHSNSENYIVIGSGFTLGGRIDFLCNRSTAFIGGGNVQRITILCDGSDSVFYCGPNSYIGDMTCWIQGQYRTLSIGEDCMFGWKIAIRTGDFHGMYDLETKKILNPPDDTTIGPHVWLTNSIQIMKGITIGSGAVIGAGSIVTKNIAGSCLAAGSPVKILRRNIGWSRDANPSLDYMAELGSRLYMVTAKQSETTKLARPLGVTKIIAALKKLAFFRKTDVA